MRLFSNRSFSLQNVSVMLIQMGMAGVMVLMPFFLELVKQLPTDTAGTVLLALPIGMILTSPSRRFSDVIGTKKPIIIGFALCAVALFFLSTLVPPRPVSAMWESTCSFWERAPALLCPPLNSAVMGESAPPKDRGTTSGLIKMMTNLGSALGVALVMLVAAAALGPKLADAPHMPSRPLSLPVHSISHSSFSWESRSSGWC